MYISIGFAIVSCFLSCFIYEVSVPIAENKEEQKNQAMHLTKNIFYILLMYGILYSIIELGQNNTKLILQYNMDTFLSSEKTVLYLSFIIAFSRGIRIISNLVFNKVYLKIKNKFSMIANFALIASFSLILLGNFIQGEFIGIGIISLGFFLFLALRDPLENYCRTILLDHCLEQDHEQAVVYFTLSRRISNLFISLLITLMLLRLDIKYIFVLLLVVSILMLPIVKKIYHLVRKRVVC